MDSMTHFESSLDVLTALAIFRPSCTVSLYEWRLCSPWLAMAPGEGTPKTIGWGCAARFPKPLPYLRPKSAIFLTLFMT